MVRVQWENVGLETLQDTREQQQQNPNKCEPSGYRVHFCFLHLGDFKIRFPEHCYFCPEPLKCDFVNV